MRYIINLTTMPYALGIVLLVLLYGRPFWIKKVSTLKKGLKQGEMSQSRKRSQTEGVVSDSSQ